jgi:ribosomal protein S18 acetylase RimI-like enzyme
VTIRRATSDDAVAIAAVRSAAAERLTGEYGPGHWSSLATERGVLSAMQGSNVLVAEIDDVVVGTLRLVTKKPWAIDPNYFTAVKRPIYLVDMAVHPDAQRRGVGRRLIEHAVNAAQATPVDAIRLDAYDHPAGAGEFYAKCGFAEVGRVTYRGTPLAYYELVV